ncbi:MAG TPA: hypothetical protein VGM90_09715 [Kofleriaceae bacterium]
MKTSLFLVSVLALGACGGGGGSGGDTGGVPGSTKLVDLTQAQTDALCHAEASTAPKESFTCPDGTTHSRGVDDAECTNAEPIGVSASCTATVSDLVNCFDDIDGYTNAQLCDETSSNIPASCAFLVSCGGSGSDGSGSARVIETARTWLRATHAAR